MATDDRYEPLDDDTPEVVVLRPGESAPDEPDDGVVKMTREEFAALQKKVDMASDVSKGIEQLGAVLRPANTAQRAPQQYAGESDDAFSTRLEAELFKPGNAAKILQETVNRFMKPQLSSMSGTITAQARKLLELDPDRGPVFKRFSKEIDQVVAGLPAEHRTNPQVYDWAFDQDRKSVV